jgi:hypothetical protein
MHLLHSPSTIVRLRLSALLYCIRCLLPMLTGVVLVLALTTSNNQLAILGIAGIALTVLTAIFQWRLSRGTRCPLCMTPVLATNHCAKHRHARSLLGSYRLPVVLTILFKNTFLCPYCNEKTAVALRNKTPGKPDPQAIPYE